MPKQLTTQSYQTLVSQIQNEIQGLKFLVEKATVQTYWEIGQFIHTYLLNEQNRAGYGDHLYERLAQDVGVHERTLINTVKFYQSFPILNTCSELSWSHYRELITISDPKKRDKIRAQVIKNKWTVRELAEHLAHNKPSNKRAPVLSDKTQSLPEAKRGELYYYRLMAQSHLHYTRAKTVLDLGFNIQRDLNLDARSAFKPDQIVYSTPAGDGFDFKVTPDAEDKLYTYQAWIQSITDGDTLRVVIDAGFGVRVRHYLRLLGIDAPELSTKAGQRIQTFLQKLFLDIDFVVVRTKHADKYGRYLADVFYLPGQSDAQVVAAEGIYLNQQLLDEGLAQAYA